jgi:hypothetical protein
MPSLTEVELWRVGEVAFPLSVLQRKKDGCEVAWILVWECEYGRRSMDKVVGRQEGRVG